MRIGIVFLESEADTHNGLSALSVCSLKDYFTFLPQARMKQGGCDSKGKRELATGPWWSVTHNNKKTQTSEITVCTALTQSPTALQRAASSEILSTLQSLSAHLTFVADSYTSPFGNAVLARMSHNLFCGQEDCFFFSQPPDLNVLPSSCCHRKRERHWNGQSQVSLGEVL